MKKPNAIKSCKHFKNNEHIFSKHVKIIIIEQLRNINTRSTETLKLRSRERVKGFGKESENFDTIWLKPRT